MMVAMLGGLMKGLLRESARPQVEIQLLKYTTEGIALSHDGLIIAPVVTALCIETRLSLTKCLQ